MLPELLVKYLLTTNGNMNKTMPPLSKFAVDPAAENSVVIPYAYVTCNSLWSYNFNVTLDKEWEWGVHIKC